METTIIDEETNTESQTWSAPANFEIPTKFEDIQTEELTDEQDQKIINESITNDKDQKIIDGSITNDKDQEIINRHEEISGEGGETTSLSPKSSLIKATGTLSSSLPKNWVNRQLVSMINLPTQKAYNNLLDFLSQPKSILGGRQLDPDEYSYEKFPWMYEREFVLNENQALIQLKEGIDENQSIADALDPNTSRRYETRLVGPILSGNPFDPDGVKRSLVSIAGKEHGLLGSWIKPRTANEEGKWEDYNFLWSDKPLAYEENILTVGVPWLLTFVALSRKGQIKADAFNLKKVESMFRLGLSKGTLNGLLLRLKARGLRASTEGLATSAIVNQIYGTPGDTELLGAASDFVTALGDQMGVDLRNPIIEYFNSENTANDPYQKAKTRNAIAQLLMGPIEGFVPEGIGMTKNLLIKSTPAVSRSLYKGLASGFETQIEKFSDFIFDLLSKQKAESDLNLAKTLAKKGPETIKQIEVIPTERVTGSNLSKKTGKKIEQKGTQEELDAQVKEAEVEVLKTEENIDKSMENLQKRDGLIQKILLNEQRKVAQSDARTLRETDAVLKQTRKGRKKIEPGTPHPTDPNKVRSNNGRWVTKAYYDKVNKALAGAEEIKKEVGSTFYHGTSKNNIQEVSGADVQLYGPGVYLTSSKKAASRHGSNVLKTQIDRNNLVDLGEFPKGNNKAINALYDQSRKLRAEGKDVLIRNHHVYGDLIIANPKGSLFAKDKAKIKDLGDSIKKAEEVADSQKTLEQIEAETELLTDAEIKEKLRDNPKYTKLINDMDQFTKETNEILKDINQRHKNIDRIIRETDEYLDGLDEQIFDPKTTIEDRLKLERMYASADANRQDLKLEKKYQAEHLTNEIGTKSETVENPLTERPFFDFDIKGAKPTYRQMKIEFESDVDRAIYIVTKRTKGSAPAKSRPLYIEQSNKNASSANHRYLEFLYEHGIGDELILKHAPKIYNKMADNYSANSVYNLKDTGAWKDGSDFDFEDIDALHGTDAEGYQSAERLRKLIEKNDKKLTEEYQKLKDPKDPGDPFDPNNFDQTSFEAPKLPILPRKGVKGKAYETQLTKETIISKIDKGTLWSPSGLTKALSTQQYLDIQDVIYRIAGRDANISLKHEFITKRTKQSALAYGYTDEVAAKMAGQEINPRGAYKATSDLVVVSMMFKNEYVEYSRAIQTAFHESFHRLQTAFLTPKELEILKKAAPKFRKIVKENYPEMSDEAVNKLSDKELQAFAFGAWSKESVQAQYKTTWMQPLRKIAKIIEGVTQIFRQEYKTWDNLFEAAAKGDIAKREFDGVTPVISKEILYEIDPDELIDEMGKYQDAIKNGDITLDTAMESETRRLISRSGQTDFVDRDNQALIAMNATMEDAIRGAFGSREEVTNMPAYQLRQVWEKAAKQVKEDGFSPAKTIELYEYARKGDIQAMDDIYAAAGILYHRDLNLKLMTEAAVGYNGADTNQGAALFGRKLLARMEDQIKLDIAWTSVTRKTAQILRLAATPHEDVLASSLDSGVELKMTVSKEAATAATSSGGFVPQTGLIGDGVYFSTSSTPGPVGSVELYGTTPEDILILDLVSTNKRITDLINELGLGVTKKTKDGIQLTSQQQAGIKKWAAEQGYSGIRYGTDFTKNPKTGDQVVVFDVNTANRMIDSDAAVPPPKKEGPSIKSLLQTALERTEEVLGKKLPRDVRKSIKSGDLTPEAKKILDTLAAITYSIKDDAGAKRAMSDFIERVPDGQLNSSTWANIYRNSIFFRMRTWMKVLFGSGYRAATLPITQLVGEFGDQLNMSDAQIKLSQRRQHLNLMIYPQYMRNIPYALRMMVAAMKHNEVFVNLGRRKYENLSTRSFKERQEQLEFDFEAKTRLTEQPPEGHFMLDENANPIAQGFWQIATTTSGRVLAGFDTFMAAITGPSTEWARIMEMELFNADVKGFEPGSSKAWDWAANRADEMLKSHFQDVDLVNGDIIKNGRLTGKHAKKAMDWVNFTDSVKVQQEEMSYEYAVRQAREEGITSPLKIVERADFLMKEELNQGGELREAIQDGLNFIPDAVSKAHGSDNPWISNTMGIAIPIMKTPANLTKSVLRSTPGLNRVVDSYWRDIHSEDPFTKSRALGESGVAMITLAFGVMIVNSGYVEVTGPPSLSTARRKELAEKGWQAWSIRFKNPWAGDTEDEWSPYYSIEMFDQLATVLGAVGAYTENYKGLRQEDRDALFGAGMIALGQTAQEIGIGQLIKGPTKSLTDLMDLVSELASTEKTKAGSRSPWEYYLTQKLAGYWPGFMDESRNAVDPYQKQINPSKLPVGLNLVENVAKTVAAKTPGLSDLIPNRLHPVTGNPIVSYQTPGNQGIDKDMPWLKMANANMPWGVTKTRSLSTDPVDEEMLRIKGRGGTFQIWSRRAFGLPDRVLDQNELNRLIEIGTKEIKIHGLTMHQALTEKINSPVYQSLPYESVSSSISTSRGLSLMKTIKPYIDKAKDAFEIEYDTGIGSLGWEIKDFRAEKERRQYNANRTEAIIQNSNTPSEFIQRFNY